MKKAKDKNVASLFWNLRITVLFLTLIILPNNLLANDNSKPKLFTNDYSKLTLFDIESTLFDIESNSKKTISTVNRPESPEVNILINFNELPTYSYYWNLQHTYANFFCYNQYLKVTDVVTYYHRYPNFIICD